MSGESITVAQAKELKKTLEVVIMSKIHEYEEVTGLRVTKAGMSEFAGKRYFGTTIFMPPKLLERSGDSDQ